MTAQSRGLNVAVRNANDAISFAQTAEGALIEVSNMLQRMRELAVQASTGTISTTQRAYLATEATALADQIDSTIANTRWNGITALSSASMTTGLEIQTADQGGETTVGQVATKKTVTTNGSRTVTMTLAAHGLVVGDTVRLTQAAGGAEDNVNLQGLFRVEARTTDTFSVVAVTTANANNALDGANAAESFIATVDVTKVTGKMAVRGGDLSSVAKTTLLAADSNMSDAAKSSAALAKIDTGLEAVNTARANLGASVNRLTSVVDNLTNVSQNLIESRSRILDTDYAAATTELARTQIIQQAGMAVLAQANQQPQSVLSLLRS
jgi:flagellin